MYKFQLMIGTHAQKRRDADGNLVKNEEGKCITDTYTKGDIFDTVFDLREFNTLGAQVQKFRLIEGYELKDLESKASRKGQKAAVQIAAESGFSSDQGGTAVATTPKTELEGMTVQQLRQMAEDLEIDLGTATKKDEIINTIQSAMDVR